jgi:hypothetical protein
VVSHIIHYSAILPYVNCYVKPSPNKNYTLIGDPGNLIPLNPLEKWPMLNLLPISTLVCLLLGVGEAGTTTEHLLKASFTLSTSSTRSNVNLLSSESGELGTALMRHVWSRSHVAVQVFSSIGDDSVKVFVRG